MNCLYLLSTNLSDIVFTKLFKNVKTNNNHVIHELQTHFDDWNKNKNKIEEYKDINFYKFYYFEQIYLCGDKCNYCHNYGQYRGFFQFFHEYPIYETHLAKKNIYKNIKDYKRHFYYDIRKHRATVHYNYLCYGCYFGYSKTPCKFFIDIS